MRKKLALVLAVLVPLAAIAAWAALRASRPEAEWTASPAALAALERGLDAERKYYLAEARRSFAEAVRLDPQCAACRLGMLRNERLGPDRAEAAAAELRALDRERLNERERFLVDSTVARLSGEHGRAAELAREYAQRHPDDPFALEAQAEVLWRERRFDEVERTYERMLEIDPNYLSAQNRLGYLALAQGRFASAEERFLTYRYVAPDQANPHDSLGELYVITGRWDEARAALEEALRVRPDFCASYENLIHVAVLTGEPREALPVLRRAAEPGRCDEYTLERQRCRIELWMDLEEGRHAELADGFEASCSAKLRVSPWIPHLAALLEGDLEAARNIEAWVRAQQRKREEGTEGDPTLPHLLGMRLVAEGDPASAAARFAEADERLDSWIGNGIFKLYNRLQWVNALELAGDSPAAAKLLAEVAAVNRPLADRYRAGEVPRSKPLAGSDGRRPGSARTLR